MEFLKELAEFGHDNWPLLKDILAALGGGGTVLASVLAITGIRSRWQKKREDRRIGRIIQMSLDKGAARERSEWFASIYHAQQERWAIDNIAAMTVQQVCGLMDWKLPGWATDGWERVLVGDLNRRAKK